MIWLLLAPSLAIFFLYRIVPLGWNAVLSVQKWSPLRPAEFAGLYHYEEMLFHDDVFWTSLANTLVYMASAPAGIALALALALLVNAGIRGRTVYRAIIFVSYPLMTVAVGIIWRWLYDEKLGLINYALIRLGVIDKGIAFLDSFTWAMPAVIVATIWQIVGFFMIILLAGLQSIRPTCTRRRPSTAPARASASCASPCPSSGRRCSSAWSWAIINSFTSFDLIYVMTRGGPNYATELLITYIYRAAFVLTQLDYAAALTVVLFVLLLGVTWAANRASGGEAGAVEAAE